jgi:hypothetical protein
MLIHPNLIIILLSSLISCDKPDSYLRGTAGYIGVIGFVWDLKGLLLFLEQFIPDTAISRCQGPNHYLVKVLPRPVRKSHFIDM